MSRRALSLIAIFLVGHTAQQSVVTVIPRYSGPLTAEDGRYLRGMNYDPADAPLVWKLNGDLLVAHSERYSRYDVVSETCAGSGFFVVPASGGQARAIAVGAPACRAALTNDGVAADPSGTSVVYSTWVPPNNSRLIRVELSTGRIDTLSTGCKIYQEHPTISANGALIASHGMCRDRNEDHYRIYVTAADGAGLRTVVANDSASWESPSWSPDARQLAFERSRGIGKDLVEEIAVIALDGHGMHVLTRGIFPAWSPDGRLIAFVQRSGGDAQTLRIIRPDGTGERLLFRSTERTTYSRGWGPMQEGRPWGPLVWSADSRWLAFTRSFDRGTSIWRIEVASGRLVQVTAPAAR